MSQVENVLVVEYNRIWPDKPKDWTVYLKGISKSTLSKFAVHFLGSTNVDSTPENVDDFLNRYFSKANYSIKALIRGRIMKLFTADIKFVSIIHPGTLLTIFSYADSLKDEEDTVDEATAEMNFFKAIFALNQKMTSHEREQLPTIKKHVSGTLELACLSLTQNFAHGDFGNFDLFEKFTCQVVKAVHLFEYMESNREFDEVLKRFVDFYECSSWQEFMDRIATIGFMIINKKKDGSLTIGIERNELYEKNCRFFDKLIYNDSGLEDEDYDFTSIRNKPLYKAEEGQYNIVFDLFAIEKIFKSQYFILKQIFESLEPEIKAKLKKEYGFTLFRTHYTTNFSERHMLYSLMKRSFSHNIIISGSDFKAAGITEKEPDYYMRNGNSIIIFESKDNFIAGNIKSSKDFEKYHKALSTKFNSPKVGVEQLFGNIQQVFQKKFNGIDKGLNDLDFNSIKVYPVLLVHDSQFNALGLNKLIDSWFKKAVSDYGRKNQIAPLVIIDIDTLILFSGEFKNGTIKLEDAIDNYIRHINNPFLFGKEITSSLIPFYYFLKNTYKMNPKEVLTESAATYLKK